MPHTDAFGFDYGEVSVKRTSPKAVLVSNARGAELWIPRSQLHPDTEVPAKSRGMLIVKCWFARQRGWIDEAGYTLMKGPIE